jgi:tetratricopeptide (TPR) repeat protein
MTSRALLLILLFVSSSHAESFKAWAARASREEREKDDKAAYQSYSNALSSWKESDGLPGKAKVLCARGAMRDKSGDEAGALEDYAGCLAIDKKNSKVFDRRGQLRLKEGKLSASIDDFYKAIALNIGFATAYADRGRAYELQGDRGFAYEDYRRACELGVKAACPKAKELKPEGKAPSAKKKKGAAPKPAAAPKEEAAPPPDAEAPPAAEDADAAPAPAPEEAPAPAPKPKRHKAPSNYHPRFSDCLEVAQACVDDGNSFGTCVAKAPACEKKAVKGCCPAACLESYRKALNRGSSEAAAYRDIFTPDSSCAVPPKSDDDD